VAVVVTTLLGAGALLALAPANPARLEELLFGDLLAVRAVDLAVAGALAALVLVALAAGHRRLVLAAFDPASASSLGAPPRRVELAVLVLLAVAVVAAVQGLGNLLVLSLIVGPAAAARRLGRRPPETLLIAAALAMAAGVAGLYASYELDIAGGAAVALASTAVFVLSLAGGRWSVGRLGPGGDPGALRLAGRRPRRQAS
jgi:ABC-type Mn2+/Zn2+ transport system permease subunit